MTYTKPQTNPLTVNCNTICDNAEKKIIAYFSGDITVLICPGVCDTSSSYYVKTFITLAQKHGIRVAVMNYLGVPKNVPLTSPRIFNYGK